MTRRASVCGKRGRKPPNPIIRRREPNVPAYSTLTLHHDSDSISTITLNRPETRNAINHKMAEELAACLAELAALNALRVVVMTGAGSAFSSGGDLKERAEIAPEATRRHREAVLHVVELLEALPVPVIAMVNGPAVAGGLELMLGCDIRVSSDKAIFALTEVRNTGSFPGAGGPARLSKQLGRHRANYIVYTGRRLSAEQALDFGLVELVVPHSELRDQVYQMAREIAGNSPLGIRAVKPLIHHASEVGLWSASEMGRRLRDPLDSTKDYREGVNAWNERRDPKFVGA
jgi:enoyl-CoA hydratase/carnithine racemase